MENTLGEAHQSETKTEIVEARVVANMYRGKVECEDNNGDRYILYPDENYIKIL